MKNTKTLSCRREYSVSVSYHFFEIDKVKCLQTQGRRKVIDIGGGGQSSAEGLGPF